MASLDANYDEVWARGCLDFNGRAVDLIKRTDSIRYVFISSPFAGYLDLGALKLFNEGRAQVGDRTIALENLVRTVLDLQSHHKRVIMIAPPPTAGFDIGACHEQQNLGLFLH